MVPVPEGDDGLSAEVDRRSLTLAEYRDVVEGSEVPTEGDALTYFALGVAGEAGEVADSVKKLRRRENPPGDFTVENDPEEVAEELGDLLWYVDRLSNEIGLSLGEVLAANAEKIERRHD